MLNEQGYEIPDNTPVSIPTRLRLPASRTEQIRAFIRSELSYQSTSQGQETFSEADDFDLPDGEPWASPYEETFDPPAFTEGGSPGDPVKPGEGAVPPAKPTSASTPNEPKQPV